MKLQDFKYTLPDGFIAQHPLVKRDDARLMVVNRKTGAITHDVFYNVGKYLPAQSTIVLNNSKVVPARLFGKREKTGGRVEVFLLKKLSDGFSFEALIKPLKKLKIDEKIIFNGYGVYAQLKDAKKKIVRFNRKNISSYLNRIGHIPLPPYIKRNDVASDREDYQTVYAKEKGSVASPTAGLHFTKPLLAELKKSGHNIETVTLHINYATFQTVTSDDITQHNMHSEAYTLTQKTHENINRTKTMGQKVVAVGTTSCRTLETVAQTGRLKGETNLFIYPGFQFQKTDILLTNFHLSGSTLFILVCAFAGRDLMMCAYQEAIAKKYRFFSYGDCMLII